MGLFSTRHYPRNWETNYYSNVCAIVFTMLTIYCQINMLLVLNIKIDCESLSA